MKFDTMILIKIKTDLLKERARTSDNELKEELGEQIEALDAIKKEVDDFRTIKDILLAG